MKLGIIRLICVGLAFSLPFSCKQRNDSKLLDAVDTKNAFFGTGRSVSNQAPKRNCFKRDAFLENQAPVATTEGSDSEQKAAAGRLTVTRINQMNTQTNMISTSNSKSNDSDYAVSANVEVPSGLLKSLKFTPEFSAKFKSVLSENKKSNIDSYILTVKYLSHAVSIQPDNEDFKPEVLTLLDGKEEGFKRFLAACGDEFLSMKEYGGEINLVFGANSTSVTSDSNTRTTGGVKISGPEAIGGSANVSGGLSKKISIVGIDKISNFAMSENILSRTAKVDCAVSRLAEDGTSTSVTYDRPFLPRNKIELDEFIFCLPRWIESVPISFNYADYSTALPLDIDQAIIDNYQTNYLGAKKARSERLLAEEQALLAQVEQEQKKQEAAVPGVQVPEKKVREFPKLNAGKYPNGYHPSGSDRQTRLKLIQKYIRENQVFATPSECALAGCSGYNESSGACTRCEEPVQGLGLGGINFCREDTDCRENASCQAANDGKTGICR